MGDPVRIKVLSGPSVGDVFTFVINQGEKLSIGRVPSCDLVLQDPAVSRQHATIERSGSELLLVDNHSTCGTVHMGFQLQAGDVGARKLSSGDEFKIGPAIFQIEFERPVSGATAVWPHKTDVSPSVPFSSSFLSSLRSSFTLRSRRYRWIIVLLLGVLLVGILLMPMSSKSVVPKQSRRVMSLPQSKVVGYMKAGRKKYQRDLTHADKADFNIRPADLVIDYEYRSETKVDLLIDSVPLVILESHKEDWQYRQLIVRDLESGRDRLLTFDSQGYSASLAKKRPKRWAVRNIRDAPLNRLSAESLNQRLRAAISLSETIDNTPESLYRVTRAVQHLILELVAELKLSAVEYDISFESTFFAVDELVVLLRAISEERAESSDPVMFERHLGVLTKVVGRLEAELWRRVNSRLHSAKLAAQSKDYIRAHDILLGTMRMFPDESDERWIMANRLFMKKKIVPRKVRNAPVKYRKKRYAR